MPDHHVEPISRRLNHQKMGAFSLEIKMLDEGGHFAGYASVFDVPDSQRDIIARGAFERSLAEKRGSIRLLWQHKQDEPIGLFSHIFEDSKGLYVEGMLILSSARGKEAHSLLKSGAIDGLSIGFVPVKFHYETKNNFRMITDLDLFEISLVTFPANENARVTVVKSGQNPLGEPAMMEWKRARESGQLIKLCEAIEFARRQLQG